MDYDSVRARLKQIRYEGLKEYFIGTLREMLISAKSIKNNPISGKKHMDDETRAELEAYVKSYGQVKRPSRSSSVLREDPTPTRLLAATFKNEIQEKGE